MHDSVMFIFAGNNGSGKSTIRNLIVDRLGLSVNVDPDALARGIDFDNPEKRRVSAGKKAIRLIQECIERKRDFSIETTLAGGNAIRQIRDAKAIGFEVTMFYIGLGDPMLNIERVAARVRSGGHHISSEDILRREKTSRQNLILNIELIDNLIVIDNSKLDGVIVLEAIYGKIRYLDESYPEWVEPIVRKLSK